MAGNTSLNDCISVNEIIGQCKRNRVVNFCTEDIPLKKKKSNFVNNTNSCDEFTNEPKNCLSSKIEKSNNCEENNEVNKLELNHSSLSSSDNSLLQKNASSEEENPALQSCEPIYFNESDSNNCITTLNNHMAHEQFILENHTLPINEHSSECIKKVYKNDGGTACPNTVIFSVNINYEMHTNNKPENLGNARIIEINTNDRKLPKHVSPNKDNSSLTENLNMSVMISPDNLEGDTSKKIMTNPVNVHHKSTQFGSLTSGCEMQANGVKDCVNNAVDLMETVNTITDKSCINLTTPINNNECIDINSKINDKKSGNQAHEVCSNKSKKFISSDNSEILFKKKITEKLTGIMNKEINTKHKNSTKNEKGGFDFLGSTISLSEYQKLVTTNENEKAVEISTSNAEVLTNYIKNENDNKYTEVNRKNITSTFTGSPNNSSMKNCSDIESFGSQCSTLFLKKEELGNKVDSSAVHFRGDRDTGKIMKSQECVHTDLNLISQKNDGGNFISNQHENKTECKLNEIFNTLIKPNISNNIEIINEYEECEVLQNFDEDFAKNLFTDISQEELVYMLIEMICETLYNRIIIGNLKRQIISFENDSNRLAERAKILEQKTRTLEENQEKNMKKIAQVRTISTQTKRKIKNMKSKNTRPSLTQPDVIVLDDDHDGDDDNGNGNRNLKRSNSCVNSNDKSPNVETKSKSSEQTCILLLDESEDDDVVIINEDPVTSGATSTTRTASLNTTAAQSVPGTSTSFSKSDSSPSAILSLLETSSEIVDLTRKRRKDSKNRSAAEVNTSQRKSAIIVDSESTANIKNLPMNTDNKSETKTTKSVESVRSDNMHSPSNNSKQLKNLATGNVLQSDATSSPNSLLKNNSTITKPGSTSTQNFVKPIVSPVIGNSSSVTVDRLSQETINAALTSSTINTAGGTTSRNYINGPVTSSVQCLPILLEPATPVIQGIPQTFTSYNGNNSGRLSIGHSIVSCTSWSVPFSQNMVVCSGQGHPAPLPENNFNSLQTDHVGPPQPVLTLNRAENGVALTWQLNVSSYEQISHYEVYHYKEIAGMIPSINCWNKIGNIRSMKLPMACTISESHPAPLPENNFDSLLDDYVGPPQPFFIANRCENGLAVALFWQLNVSNYEQISHYELYHYKETAGMTPSTNCWKKIGDIISMKLPMACTLSGLQEGYMHHLALRAVDTQNCVGLFSSPCSILFTHQEQGNMLP